MFIKQQFDSNKLVFDELGNSFKNFSAVKISNLYSQDLCEETNRYILNNEQDLIETYKDDKRGMVVDEIENRKFIKYFDKPLSCNYQLFSKFIVSHIFNIGRYLLKEEVFLQAFEIHSRCAYGTPIPPHQDNAYFGLKRSKSLTFYISLNPQYPDKGGLKYYKIPIGPTLEHESSSEPGFSLTVKNKNYEKLPIFNPSYNIGDCTIHHSTSVHFADAVPSDSDRVIVVRLSLHSVNDFIKAGHKEWYEEMVKRNRNQ